jgi:hypothetical protein
MNYIQALKVAADLLRDGSDSEYRRGQVELLADMFPEKGIFMADRKDKIESDLQRLGA